MRLSFLSDLHVEYQLEVVGLVAERLARLRPDAFVLAGDVCPDFSRLESALRLMVRAVDGPVLYLPGNHELWCGGASARGPNSRERYEHVLPAIARRAGAVPLGLEPVVIQGVAFVGVTGWYDYSLRDPALSDVVESDDYARKRFADVTCVDGEQIHWPDDEGTPLNDADLCHFMVQVLRTQLDAAVQQASRIVVVTHMLPHRDLLTGPDRTAQPPELRFLDGFMGSQALGEVLREYPGVVLVIAGHHHRAVRRSLPGAQGPVFCEISPVGYPREGQGSLSDRVRRRVKITEI